ncbi:MAG: leucine-rich repeat domain-containing protein [Clostridia bacterium]|nr:leucine-rich repeat domain-containing protein [Clostridia bacterium]
MKKTVKKFAALALCLLLLGAVMLPAGAAGGVDGTVTWNYDPETKTLTFSGNGKISDYRDEVEYEPGVWHTNAPWGDYYNEAETLVIEPGVTSIGMWAFSNFLKLKTVSLPSTLEFLDAWAFHMCRSIEEITLPSSIVQFGTSSFSGCTSLRKVEFMGVPYSIPHQMFRSCSSLTSIVIPEGVHDIGSAAFSNCTSLKTVTIPKSMSYILVGAFFNAGVETVYYGGTEADWNSIDIGGNNEKLLEADIHFTYAAETETPDAPAANICHWCGKVHGGGFDAFIAWIHNLLAKIFGAKF